MIISGIVYKVKMFANTFCHLQETIAEQQKLEHSGIKWVECTDNVFSKLSFLFLRLVV